MPPATETIQGFAPVIGPDPRVLLLGSMPGVASLEATQYYAHPRNRFWPLMAALLEESPSVDYASRLAMLQRHGIALWDVLGQCQRAGSLDSAIDRESQQPNPIPHLLAQYPSIQTIGTNGGFATRAFTKAFPKLAIERHVALPSTSPANARWSMQALYAAWHPVMAHAR